ncbi:MAG: hypothetical protein MI755_16685 [Sphingomonadales bacterium]|nr:hypothetical protein [Sphingomonadales bacterium]
MADHTTSTHPYETRAAPEIEAKDDELEDRTEAPEASDDGLTLADGCSEDWR